MRYAVFMFLFITLALPYASAQNTPPGGDQVGSDRHVGQGGLDTKPTNDPEANQRVTGTTGSTTGNSGSPVFAGAGSDDRTNTENPSAAGQSGETGVAAARRSDAKRVQSAAGTKSGDNGSVWHSQNKRESNVVGTTPQQHNSTTPARKTSKQTKTSKEQ